MVIAIDHGAKHVVRVVKGKAHVADAPVGDRLVRLRQQVAPLHRLPTRRAHTVKQVEINVIRLQLFQLLVQQPVKVLAALDDPHRQLGGQFDLVAVATTQRLAHQPLAIAAVVAVRRVKPQRRALPIQLSKWSILQRYPPVITGTVGKT